MRAVLLFLLFFPYLAEAGSERFAAPPADSRDPARVVVPDNYDAAKPWPLILLLHGYTESSAFIDAYFGFSAEATRRSYILVVPNGRANAKGQRYWNASDACCDFEHAAVDDIAYLTNLMKQVQAKYRVDTKRIYVAGHSNGGFMAHRLACEPGRPFSALVSFAGVLPSDPANCQPSHPVSVLQIHALDDDTIRFAGDPVGYPGLKSYPSVDTSLSQWAKQNHCGPVATMVATKDLTYSIPGPDAEVKGWQSCASGSEVQLWTIRAHRGLFHFPHTPLLRGEFTDSVLDFLLGH